MCMGGKTKQSLWLWGRKQMDQAGLERSHSAVFGFTLALGGLETVCNFLLPFTGVCVYCVCVCADTLTQLCVYK